MLGRLAFGVVALAVGLQGCSIDGGSDGPPADAEQFCVDRGDALCRRARQRCLDAGMTTEDCNSTYLSCREPLLVMCTGAAWSPRCGPPSQEEADDCIEALLDPATLSVPDDAIPACERIECG